MILAALCWKKMCVSAAGAPHRFTYKSIQQAIREAGFEPQLRNQQYEWETITGDDRGAGD
jgi:hypothetical protein